MIAYASSHLRTVGCEPAAWPKIRSFGFVGNVAARS
jgi:hypothetical protein